MPALRSIVESLGHHVAETYLHEAEARVCRRDELAMGFYTWYTYSVCSP
jgi:hypothetical protein